MKRICILTTVSSSIDNWIKPFLEEYRKSNIDVTIVCNMSKEYEAELKRQYGYIHTVSLPFPRGSALMGSLRSIFQLLRLFRKQKFDMIQYSTPNASMYASVAGWLAGIPVRLYCQWGMVYVTRKGLSRFFLEIIERMVCLLSTAVQPDSIGNLDFCRKHKLYSEKKSSVIWNGSAKGLDLCAYNIEQKPAYRKAIREQYGIADKPVIGFVGRLGKEKGCNELFRAFQKLQQEIPGCTLLFVGPIEKEETIDPELLTYFRSCNDIIKTGRVSHVEQYMSAMDIFVLPSYREGFGMSVIEASAMELPVIVTQYPGPSSAMVDGVTGISVPVADEQALYQQCLRLLQDPQLSQKMGLAGRIYVREHYDQKIFKEKCMENRLSLINKLV